MLKLDSTIVVGEVVEANLRVRTGPGSPGKIFNPCKPWKSPGIFLLSPGKSHRTLFKKIAKCILLISLQVTIAIVNFRIISKLHFVLETTA